MTKEKNLGVSVPENATPDERRAAYFNALYSLNVNDKVEKKNDLTYLSWANAWAEFKKIYPSAKYQIYKNPETGLPYVESELGIMVYTEVTADDLTYQMWLPVMNGANQAMLTHPQDYKTKNASFKYATKGNDGIYRDRYGNVQEEWKTVHVDAATMFDVNKAIMRCLVKNLSMYGLGLYLYAGEDLPEAINTPEPQEEKPTATPKATTTRKPRQPKAASTAPSVATPPVNRRLELIRNAVNSVTTIDDLLTLYSQHAQEISANPEFKALFTERKNQLTPVEAF